MIDAVLEGRPALGRDDLLLRRKMAEDDRTVWGMAVLRLRLRVGVQDLTAGIGCVREVMIAEACVATYARALPQIGAFRARAADPVRF